MQERNWARGTVHRDKEKKLSASPPPWSIEAINTTVGYIDQEHLSHLPFEGWSNAPDLLWTPMLSHKCRLHVKLQWLWQKITGEHEDWKLGECIVSLVNNASSRGGKNKRGKMNITHPLTDRQRDTSGKTKRPLCVWLGLLFTILVSMRTQDWESEQVVTSKSRATHPVGFYNQESYTSHKHRAANEATCWDRLMNRFLAEV